MSAIELRRIAIGTTTVVLTVCAVVSTSAAATPPFDVHRSMYPDLVRGSAPHATVSASSFDDAPGVLDDGVSEYYTATDASGTGVEIEVEKNLALGTVRIHFVTELTGGPGPEYMDAFDSASFSQDDGTYQWSGAWQESGESDGASGGILRVVDDPRCTSGSCLRIGHADIEDQTTKALVREADLGSATTATLSYDFEVQNTDNKGTVYVRISGDGGTTWSTLATYGPYDGGGSANFDITSFASANTRIRFDVSDKFAMYLFVDEVRIDFE